MNALADFIILSWGWRRRGLAFGAGALSALAMAPFFAFPVLWLTFPVLVWLVDGSVESRADGGLRRVLPAFRIGWWFGFGYFLAGLWWIGAAFLVEAGPFVWLMPLAVLATAAGLALFWGLGVAAAQLLWTEDWRRVFALAAGLGTAEWLRGHVLTGFPWNAIGYALTAGEILMQSAALFGVEALSFIAVVVFAAPAVLLAAGRSGRGNRALPVGAALAVAGLAAFGMIRLQTAATRYQPDVTVRIVQPNLDQGEKWGDYNRDEVLRTYTELSAPAGSPLGLGTLLVWPETAFPFPIVQDPAALRAIGDLLPPGSALATGAYRIEATRPGESRATNSLLLIDDTGTIQDSYDKIHLVPFGEYLPLQWALEGIGMHDFSAMPGGFSPGLRRRAITLPFGPPFSPLICYEIIFPGAVLPEGPRPGFLLNITNDGWFGRSAGPYQHFHQARVRAVEEGMPLVRAANSGISVVTDPFGRIVAKSTLGTKATLDARLPVALAAQPFEALRGFTVFIAFGICVATRIRRNAAMS